MLANVFKSVGSAFGLAAPGAPPFHVPPVLPALQVPTAGSPAEDAGLTLPAGSQPASVQPFSPLLDFLLNQKQDMLSATQVIAHGLSQRDGIRWAVDSCRKVEAKLPPEHREAIAAADAFAVSPTAAARARAAAAAEKVGPLSPAGLAAKAASLADVPDAPAIPGADKLVPTCVVGAVAAAVGLSPRTARLPEKPATPQLDLPQFHLGKLPAAPPPAVAGGRVSARNTIAYKPFIDAGLALAAGRPPSTA